MKPCAPLVGLSVLLAVMAILMLGPMGEDSVTVDETSFLSAGYSYMQGYKFYFDPENPPLSQLLVAIPSSFMNLTLSEPAQALLDRRVGYPWTVPWFGEPQAMQALFPEGRDSWYFWPKPEAQIFGQTRIYGGGNDGDAMMLWGRRV